MSLLEVVVTHRRQEADGICSFELGLAGGGALPAFDAGAHIDVHLPGGLVRQYSLCGRPFDHSRWRIAVLREPASRGGSAAMHDAVHEGSVLSVSRPRNHFALHPAPHSLLLAGGIGVTPLLAMAQVLHHEARDFELHCCARTAARAAFVQEIGASAYAARVAFHFDDGPPAQQFSAQAVLAAAGPQTHLYVCGPTGFMDAVLATARQLGWSDERLHREYFAAAAPQAMPTGSFDLVLARTGRRIPVAPQQTALQALLDAGVDVPSSCESGVCGTCVTRVIEGTPEHHDVFMTDAEHAAGDCFTPCCSRAKSAELVIDL